MKEKDAKDKYPQLSPSYSANQIYISKDDLNDLSSRLNDQDLGRLIFSFSSINNQY